VNENLKKEVKIQTQSFRELITPYCRLESVATQNRMMGETADWVERLLKDTGFETRQLGAAGAPNYIYGYQRGRSDFTLLLYNHYDVQPETPLDLWDSPPFEVTEREDKLYARGICDNKGELVSRICALRAILAADGELPITIKWIIEGEEEIGSPHIKAFAEENGDLLKADAALWEGSGFNEKGQAELVLGFRGLLYVEYNVEVMKQDAHSGFAHSLPSGPWRLLKALSSIKDNKGNILIPGFYEHVRQPTNSEEQALRDVVDPEMEEKILAMYGVDSFLDHKRGFELELQVFEPTANIAGFLSGYTDEGLKTVLPARAMAKMDFRLVPEQSPDDILEKLKVHLEEQGFEDIHVQKLGGAEPVVTPIESEFAQRLKKICQDFTGQDVDMYPLAGATLPLLEAMKKDVGILGISAPGNPVYYGSGAHAPNEHIRIDDITKAIDFNVFMFVALAEN